MSVLQAIEKEFKARVAEAIELRPESASRYRVLTPFRFEDGDHLVLILRQDEHGWLLTDEGHTLMRVSYELEMGDIEEGARSAVVLQALSEFGVTERPEGVLVRRVSERDFGSALQAMVQAVLRISDVTFLSQERVRSTFYADLQKVVESRVPLGRRIAEWHHPEKDPERHYPVDYKINERRRPLFVFGLPNDDKVRDATVIIRQFEAWDIPFEAVGVFENQEGINRKVLARFSDVCGKQFSTLRGNDDRIGKFLIEKLNEA